MKSNSVSEALWRKMERLPADGRVKRLAKFSGRCSARALATFEMSGGAIAWGTAKILHAGNWKRGFKEATKSAAHVVVGNVARKTIYNPALSTPTNACPLDLLVAYKGYTLVEYGLEPTNDTLVFTCEREGKRAYFSAPATVGRPGHFNITSMSPRIGEALTKLGFDGGKTEFSLEGVTIDLPPYEPIGSSDRPADLLKVSELSGFKVEKRTGDEGCWTLHCTKETPRGRQQGFFLLDIRNLNEDELDKAAHALVKALGYTEVVLPNPKHINEAKPLIQNPPRNLEFFHPTEATIVGNKVLLQGERLTARGPRKEKYTLPARFDGINNRYVYTGRDGAQAMNALLAMGFQHKGLTTLSYGTTTINIPLFGA